MKEKYLTNARIIDPKNQIDEIGGLIIDTKGLIKAIGKKVANGNLPTAAEKIDLKKWPASNILWMVQWFKDKGAMPEQAKKMKFPFERE